MSSERLVTNAAVLSSVGDTVNRVNLISPSVDRTFAIVES